MPVRWYSAVVDCHDPRAQAAWWADVIGWKVFFESDDEVVVLPPHFFDEGYFDRTPIRERGQGLVFVRVWRTRRIMLPAGISPWPQKINS